MCEEGHKIDWDQTGILLFGPNVVYRKYKEAVHMLCMSNPISQSSGRYITYVAATNKKGIKNCVKFEIRYRLLLDV